MALKVRLLAGSYTKGHEPLGYYTNTGEGASTIQLNTADGKLKLLKGPVDAGTNPTHAAFDPIRSIAYFTNENLDKGCVKAFKMGRDAKLTELNSIDVSNHPCFLSMTPDYKAVMCACYVSGDVWLFETEEDGSLKPGTKTELPADGPYPGEVPTRQDKTHAHCYLPLGTTGFGISCDLGTDQVVCLNVKDGTVVSKSKVASGSGPRHAAVSADGKWVYVSTELNNVIIAIPVDAATGTLSPPAATASLLPAGYDGPATTASHIELSSCGKFAFVANRMGMPPSNVLCKDCVEGTISVIKLAPESPDAHLTLVECKEIGGKCPRSFCVVGEWLVVVAQESSFIKSFKIGADGTLTEGHKLDYPSPGCIVPAKMIPKLRKPKFVTVDKLQPEKRSVNVYAKVVKSTPDTEGVNDVVLGDATGVVTLRATGDQIATCEVGKVVRVQNAKVVMVKNYMRVVVDKWAVVKPAPDHEDIEPKTSNDISAVEYELTG